jgi:polysaccharide biosynthesis transport protein
MKESTEFTKALEALKNARELQAQGQNFDSNSQSSGNNDGYSVLEYAGGLQLRNYWNSVRKRLWLVISISIFLTMCAVIYMARKPDVYEAKARVQVNLENNGTSAGSTKGGSFILNNPVNDPAYFNTQLQILTSKGLIRRVIKILDLEHNQAFTNPQATQRGSIWQNILRMVGLGSKSAPKVAPATKDDLAQSTAAYISMRDDLVEAQRLQPYVDTVLSGLSVVPVKETRLIDIRFNHSDPLIASKIANAIASTFVLSNLEKKTENNNSEGDFLQKRVAELQDHIRMSEERLVNYSKNNQIISLDASQNTVVERLAGLNKQLLEAENERKLAEAAYRAVRAPGAADAKTADQTRDIEDKLTDLRQKRAQLLIENTEEWPEVKEINQQIALLEKQLQDLRRRAVSNLLINLETAYRQALAREESLRAAFNQQRNETVAQNEAAINYRIIQQEIETNKSLLDNLLQRSKENDMVLAGTPNNIHVVDYSIVQDQAIGPARLRGVAISFIFSLIFGIGLALLLEYFDDTVRSTDDVENTLRLPTLAAIPQIGKTSRSLIPPVVGTRNGGAAQPELLLNINPRSAMAEAYRQLRTSVLLSTAGRAPKSLLVTSSMPAEGKTTTAINTALSLAQTGASVLLIDADMRRPRVHSVFNIENKNGLSTILSSEMNEAQILTFINQLDGINDVYVLTAGSIPPNPAELVGSKQMSLLLAALESNFTYIIIDSPPIVSFTDGVLISSIVDGVLLVIHSGKSSRAIVKRSRQLLRDVGAKIFGVVLNKVSSNSTDYYYYYNKDYHYKYYEADAGAESNLPA